MSDASFDLILDSSSSEYDPVPVCTFPHSSPSGKTSIGSGITDTASEDDASFLYYSSYRPPRINFDPAMLPISSDSQSINAANSTNGKPSSHSSDVVETGWGIIGISSRIDPIYNRFGNLRTGRDSDDDISVKQEKGFELQNMNANESSPILQSPEVMDQNTQMHPLESIVGLSNPDAIESDATEAGWKRLFSDVSEHTRGDEDSQASSPSSLHNYRPGSVSIANENDRHTQAGERESGHRDAEETRAETTMLPPPLKSFLTGQEGIAYCQAWARDHGYAISQLSGPGKSKQRYILVCDKGGDSDRRRWRRNIAIAQRRYEGRKERPVFGILNGPVQIILGIKPVPQSDSLAINGSRTNKRCLLTRKQMLEQQWPDCEATHRTIYNAQASLRRESLHGRSEIQALLDEFEADSVLNFNICRYFQKRQ
ncbi:hypothetical protein BJ508DRAFT_303149 [Ascobolus immersus RN42]|uniref:Uncharacterized protein n=1 Tax=Ascobolus immersus RN42 TaxID=1160509 RepID=A0A3N4IU31_ASCIM|nr:hypothetical protein BJ508DRAFT_303149 [Ascobolus immersus RN42]